MVAIIDVFVVDNSGGDTGESVGAAHKVEEGFLKFLREAINNAVGVLAEDLHLALMRFAQTVALEAVLVAALLLTHLTVPAKLLQALGLDPIGDGLRGEKLALSHGRRTRLPLVSGVEEISLRSPRQRGERALREVSRKDDRKRGRFTMVGLRRCTGNRKLAENPRW